MMRSKALFKFMEERHSIYERKELGYPKPWTNDEILQNYKFCNVYRELDTQTIWFAENWRTPNEDDPDLWFASLVFRFINWHETAEQLGYPVPWKSIKFLNTLKNRKIKGEKVYSGAYIISTHGSKEPKHIYLMKILSEIWKKREKLRYKENELLEDFHSRLMDCYGVGSFLAAQVIADVKYAGELKKAKDWWTFAAPGPGSLRGMNRVFNSPTNRSFPKDTWYKNLRKLHEDIFYKIEEAEMVPIHAQDLQNCLCEFDKYERVRLGEGRPRSKYKGVEDESI